MSKMPELYSAATSPIRRAERIILGVGLMLVAIWGSMRIYQSTASRAAIARFNRKVEGTSTQNLSPAVDPAVGSKVDFQLWSAKRIAAYTESLSQKNDLPIAVLRIPSLSLQVPVFNGSDDLTLNRGVGRIPGTAQIGQPGNLGIAGHRDGFFRALKDIRTGDIIQLDEGGKAQEYVVNQTQIVNPEDVYVLAPTSVPTLTLITCFPFYFIGSAPQRFVVTAAIKVEGAGTGVGIINGKMPQLLVSRRYPNLPGVKKKGPFHDSCLWKGAKKSFRRSMDAREIPQNRNPRRPTRGNSLAVLGNVVGACSCAAGAGVGGAAATRIGTSCFGAGGGGGI